MTFDIIGDKSKPCVVLIHGMLVTGRSFDAIVEILKKDYFLIIPTLDGHEEINNSTFNSAEEEADKIIEYLKKENIEEIELLLGTSLGGLIAFEIFRRKSIALKKVVIDGAPFTPCSKFMQWMMIKILLRLAKSTKKNPSKENVIDKQFSQVSNIMKKVCSYISHESIKNIIHSCYTYPLPLNLEIHKEKVIFIYGDKEPAKKCIPQIKKIHNCNLIIKEGYGHCQFLMESAQEYVELLNSTSI